MKLRRKRADDCDIILTRTREWLDGPGHVGHPLTAGQRRLHEAGMAELTRQAELAERRHDTRTHSPGRCVWRACLDEVEQRLSYLPDPDERRSLRNSLGLTGAQMARLIGLNRTTFRYWEAARRLRRLPRTRPQWEQLCHYIAMLSPAEPLARRGARGHGRGKGDASDPGRPA